MTFRKTTLVSFVLLGLLLPVLIIAKEVETAVNKDKANKPSQGSLLAEKPGSYEPEKPVDSGYSSLQYILISSAGAFEEIVTPADSLRGIRMLPAISVKADTYHNSFESGQKARRILQELLPLNIF